MLRRPPIQPDELMDAAEVAEALGVTLSTLRVALTRPNVAPTVALRLPEPLRKIGAAWVWRRVDVERAIQEFSRPA